MKLSQSKLLLLLCLTVALASCSSDDDITEPNNDTTPPTAVSFSPAENELGVSVSALITITFSEDMNTGSATNAVSLSSGTVTDLNWSTARTLNISHSEWNEGALVNVFISSSLTDLAGNSYQDNGLWQFEVEVTIPTLVSTTPADLSMGINRNTPISLLFSTKMDLVSLESAITIDDGQNPVALAALGFGVAAGDGNWVILTLDSVLAPLVDVTVTIDTSALSMAGMSLAQMETWSFTAGTEIDATPPELLSVVPANGSTIDATTPEIVFTFSEPVDPGSITVATISAQLLYVTGGADPIWSGGGTVMTLPLTTTLGAEMPLAVTIANFSDATGNEQTVPINYRVDVAGIGDPWPLIDGARATYYEEWTETFQGQPAGSGSGELFYEVEAQGGGIYRLATYWDPSYLNGTDYLIYEKTAAFVAEIGDHEVDSISGEVEDIVISPGVQWARYPFAAGSWGDDITVTFPGGSATGSYAVTVVGREDLTSRMNLDSADVTWLNCWKTTRDWTLSEGGTVIDTGSATAWYAPSVGLVKIVTHEEGNDGGGTFVEDYSEELIGGSLP